MNIEPFADNVAIEGPDAEPLGFTIDDLLRYLVTIRKRFGNTCVAYRVRWGASALWAHDEHGKEIERLKQHVADCQSGMWINCVYCGHRYGPADKTPVAMADMLKAHIAQCEHHPMSALLRVAKATDHAISSLLAVREGLTDEFLIGLQQCVRSAIDAVGPEKRNP